MARKAKESIQPVEDIKLVDNISDGINVSSMAMHYSMEFYDITKDLGRLETVDFYATISDIIRASTFTKIKNNKKYKGMPYRDENGNLRQIATLDEFCNVFLKKSYRRCMELADNLSLLGPELYDQAEKIGFKTRDYQALKALPNDEQEIVKKALESQDKESAVDLIQEMALKHKKEKELLKQQADDAKKELEISEAYNADTRKERDDLKLKLKKYELNTVPMDERLEPFSKKVASIQSEMDRLFEEKRQLLDMLYQMSLELMDKDPEYVKGKYYPLPKTMQNAISVLNGSSIISLDQAKQFHRSLWDKFLSDLEDIQDTTFNLHNESLIIDENN